MNESQSSLQPRAAVRTLPPYSKAFAAAVPPVYHASSNESPFPTAPAVLAAIDHAAHAGNRYPVLHGDDLIAALAEFYGVGVEHIAVGDGSLTLMTQILQTYINHGDELIFSWRSYEAYPIAAVAVGAVGVPVPNAADGGHDLDAMVAAITPRTRALIVCSPNNPTGVAVEKDALIKFLDAVPADVLVLLDEAYWDFSDEPLDGVTLLDAYTNLVVLRTFSKSYGLAGLRAGYALADASIIEAVRAIQPPFPVNAVGAAAARAALGVQDERHELIETINQQRATLEQKIGELGLPIVHSQSNFIWIPLGQASQALAARCADAGIAVRCFEDEGVRVSLGEDGIVEALLHVVSAFNSAAV